MVKLSTNGLTKPITKNLLKSTSEETAFCMGMGLLFSLLDMRIIKGRGSNVLSQNTTLKKVH